MSSFTEFAIPPRRGGVRDDAHFGHINGALGTIRHSDIAPPTSRAAKPRTLLAILAPRLTVVVGDNDGSAFDTYSQAGQDYGTTLLWTLALLIRALKRGSGALIRWGLNIYGSKQIEKSHHPRPSNLVFHERLSSHFPGGGQHQHPLVSYRHYVTFQMAEAAAPASVYGNSLSLTAGYRASRDPTGSSGRLTTWVDSGRGPAYLRRGTTFPIFGSECAPGILDTHPAVEPGAIKINAATTDVVRRLERSRLRESRRLVCRWHREGDGRLTCLWEPDIVPVPQR
jgi:hypothetical protein